MSREDDKCINKEINRGKTPTDADYFCECLKDEVKRGKLPKDAEDTCNLKQTFTDKWIKWGKFK